MEKSLYKAKKGKAYLVTFVPNHTLLSGMGLLAGSRIRVEHKYRWGGPVTVSCSTRKIAIGKEIASKVLIWEDDRL